MSVRTVADLLSLAGEGVRAAKHTGDKVLLANSERLALKALHHPDAVAFLAGISLALAETAPVGAIIQKTKFKGLPWGNDPDAIHNGASPLDPTAPDIQYDDEPQEDENQEEPQEDSQEQQATSGLVRSLKPFLRRRGL